MKECTYTVTCELIIENRDKLYVPIVQEGVTWTTERRGSPGKLTFTVIKDDVIDFTEGNPVRFTVDCQNVFYGFVFTKKRDKKHHISVTAFDQLRYLKNKETYNIKNKTASDIVKMIAGDFSLQTGDIDQTEFVIASQPEDNTALMDIIYSALDKELANKKQMYVLYDDCGKLTLKSIENMKLDLLIDEETGENFDYSTSIDDSTYNRVKLTFENEKTGKRDVYVVQDGGHITDWGLLQYVDKLKAGENGEAKAEALLELYNAKTRKLKVSKAFGDPRVRAGCLIPVMLGLGDMNALSYMLVEKVTHTFYGSDHRMDLTLRGGEIVA